ncbi:MAG: hypothetical protein GX963_07250 [Bacteroidales bacterium]|nr:hypothetical protein [Bacteroidales bacterium]
MISSKDGRRAIYIDDANSKEILSFINKDKRHRKKFKLITDIILGGHRNRELYDKENINERCKDVTAMKFFKGQENARIYCKEMTTRNGTRIVIAAVLHSRKKSQKNSLIEKTIINRVGGYIYEIY